MTDTAAAATTDTTAATTTTTANWYDGLPAEDKGFLENHGWTSKSQTEALQETIKSYRHAEQRLGAPAHELIRRPKEGDLESENAFYDALGRPKDANGYDIQVPQGEDKELAEWVAKEAHGLGLTKKQGQDLYNKLTGMVTDVTKDTNAQLEQAIGEEKAMLKNNWGQSFDKNMQIARSVVEKLGVPATTIDSLEKELGYAAVVKMFYDIGLKTGEDAVVFGSGASELRVSSKEGALAQLEALKNDRQFVKRYLEGDATANREMQKLHEIAYGV